MGPRPHLIRLTMQTLEAEMPSEEVNENIVNGKLMELKGLAFQSGFTSNMRINMTFRQYQERMKEEVAKKARSGSVNRGEEGAISVLKMAAERLLRQEDGLSVAQAFELAAHGHNQTIGSNGFSPFQWTRGSSCPQGQLPAGINPSKAFGGALKMREKARLAYEAENAKYKLSKLNNAKTRPPVTFKPGALLMLWRQRVRPGSVAGQWTGPVRSLLQEGGTV